LIANNFISPRGVIAIKVHFRVEIKVSTAYHGVTKCGKLAPARQQFCDTGNVSHFCRVPQREFTLRAAHNVELPVTEWCSVPTKLFYNSEIAVSHLSRRSDALRRNNVAASPE